MKEVESKRCAATLEDGIMAATQHNLLKGWSLESRNYVVTGGAKGIGLATVRALLAHGAAGVVLCSRSSCTDTVVSLKQEFPEATIVHVECDVSIPKGRTHLVEVAKATFPALHGLVNNVGQNIRKNIMEQKEEEYFSIMKTNVDSAYFLSRQFRDLFATQVGATIVNVSSAAGVQSSGTGAAYGSKFRSVLAMFVSIITMYNILLFETYT